MGSISASHSREAKQLGHPLDRVDLVTNTIIDSVPLYTNGYPHILWITLCVIPTDLYLCFWDQELSRLVKKSPANGCNCGYLNKLMN
jgi:hypothetical protein